MKNWRFYAIPCTSAFVQQCKLALIKIGRQVGGPITQLSKEPCTSVASMKNILLTGLEQTASLNDSTKTLVSTLTVTRWTQGCWPFEQSCKESTTSAALQWRFFFPSFNLFVLLVSLRDFSTPARSQASWFFNTKQVQHSQAFYACYILG